MTKRPFRSIGQRLRGIARTHISTYVPTGNMVSRVELPPSWQKNADEPLIWREDPPPAPVQEAAPEPVEVEEIAPGDVTNRMLQRLMEAHEDRIAREEAGKAAATEAASSVQRQDDGNDADGQPRSSTRRRRGAVIDVTSSPSSAPADEEAPPDFFFLNDPAPDDVQRVPEAAPPPAPRSRPQQPASSSNSETSFWRGLLSRGGNTPDISTERDDDSEAFAGLSETYEDVSPEAPAETSASQDVDAPRVQRKSETSARRRTSEPEIQRDADQSASTPAAEIYVPTDYEADLPAAAQIAPPTPTTPHVVQRQTGEHSAAFVPPVQRQPAPESFTVEPDRPAEAFTASSPDSPVATRETSNTSQQTTRQASPNIQRETDSPSVETSAQDVMDIIPPSTVQQQSDIPAPVQSSTSKNVPTASATTSQPATNQPTIQRQIEPETPAQVSFEAGDDSISPTSSPAFPNTQQTISQPTRSSTPSVQRETSQPSQTTSQPPSSEPAAFPQAGTEDRPAPRRVQRAADTSQVEQPATSTESQPTSDWQDAMTTLTPAPEPQSPPRVQRKATKPPTVETSEPEFTAEDAPTMLTQAPPSSTVQRQVADEPTSNVKRESRMPEVPPSPWTEFMNPAPRKSERIKRPAPPTVVQRTPETSSASESSAATPADQPYHPAQDNSPSLPEQPVDVFTALMDAGAVKTPTTASPPPQISRRTVPDTSSSSPQPPSRGEISGAGLEQHIPDTGSVEADLLSLIDMPPSTPIIRQAQTESSVSRSIEPAPEHGMSQSSGITPTIEQHTESLDSLMRAETTESSAPSSSGGEEKSGDDSGVDVDKLARDVMSVLRRRLRTEQERRGGKS